MKPPSILFVSKRRNDPFAAEALSFIPQQFPDYEIVLGTQGEKLPDTIRNWKGDYIISYLSPWIIPQSVLNNARCSAINFHPGPPEYPGIGCYNFAIYDEVKTYGITCHYMASLVDTGSIITVRRFPVFSTDSVHSIARRSSAHMLAVFYDILSAILTGARLPESTETWQRKPYTKIEMYDLFRITADMSPDEAQKRIKAAEYPGWPGAFIEICGKRFYQNTSSSGT